MHEFQYAWMEQVPGNEPFGHYEFVLNVEEQNHMKLSWS